MHDTAYKIGGLVMDTYLPSSPAKILEIGAQNVNGSLRDHSPRNAEYTGIDFEAGDGVDIVVTGLDDWNVPDAHFDLVMASSVFEHDPMFWKTFLAMCRKTKPGGHIYISAPSNGLVHRYPQDCWRFYPDAGLALETWARSEGYGVTLIESFTALRENDCWNDFCAIYQVGGNDENLNSDFVSAKLPSENIIHWRTSNIANPQFDPEDLRLWKASIEEAQQLRTERETLLQECDQTKADGHALAQELATLRTLHEQSIHEVRQQLDLTQDALGKAQADADLLQEHLRTDREKLCDAETLLTRKDQQCALINQQIEALADEKRRVEEDYAQRLAEQQSEIDRLQQESRQKDEDLSQARANLTEERKKADWLQGVVAVLTRGFAPSWKSRLAAAMPAALMRSKQRKLLHKNGLFNGSQYLERYPDVAKSGNDPFRHYILFGLNEGRHHDN